jgi:hydroxymethylpyrimidine/phosphomethylpyrimidine kinase
MPKVALTIAGLDPSGGAGLTADVQTFSRHGVHGAAIASVLTVQSTQGMLECVPVAAELVGRQLDALLADLPIAAIKTGALGTAEVVRMVANKVCEQRTPLVIDPVRSASLGGALLADDAKQALLAELLPCAHLITPNAPEAEWLTGLRVQSVPEAREAARALRSLGARAVLIKGGHLQEELAVDVLSDAHGLHELSAPRVAGADAHGLGCALSAAITAELANGRPLRDAVARAKRFVGRALAGAAQLGQGRALLDLRAEAGGDS